MVKVVALVRRLVILGLSKKKEGWLLLVVIAQSGMDMLRGRLAYKTQENAL